MTTVAVIEDNSTMRSALTKIINNAPGCRCVCACSNSSEALKLVPEHRPHVALMDIHLPDESGIACTARLTQKMPALQVIMVTVYKDTELIFQALKAGACGYLLKSLHPEEIMDAIAEVRAGGAPMTSEIARMVVRSFQGPSSELYETALTGREAEILMFVTEGLTNKEIAHKADISVGTVRVHLGHIFKKLHVRCRTEAAAKYLQTK
ncbi:MAG TPA: response regulator transcription factor [Verrucomicrobiae bacterium]|nr:response regulator transcription factor [Verrucomicrobiae bacterium]